MIEQHLELERLEEYARLHLSEERFRHVVGVRDTARELALIHRLDLFKVSKAALLHDIGRALTLAEARMYCILNSLVVDAEEWRSLALLHGPIGASIAHCEHGERDLDVLFPIMFHTTGRPGMSVYELILFVADFCEPNRFFFESCGKSILNIAHENLLLGALEVFKQKIHYIVKAGLFLHPRGIHARNDCLLRWRREEGGDRLF